MRNEAIRIGAATLLALAGAGCSRGPKIDPIDPSRLSRDAIFSVAKTKPGRDCVEMADGKRTTVKIGETGSAGTCVGSLNLEPNERDGIVPVTTISFTREQQGGPVLAHLITADGQFVTRELEFVVGAGYRFVDAEGNEYTISPQATDGSIVNEKPVKVPTPNRVQIVSTQAPGTGTEQPTRQAQTGGATPTPGGPTPPNSTGGAFNPNTCIDSFGHVKPARVEYDEGTGGGKWICRKNVVDGNGTAYYEFEQIGTDQTMYVVVGIDNPTQPREFGYGEIVQMPGVVYALPYKSPRQ